MTSTGTHVLIVGALLAAGLGASLLAGRLRLPGLLLFLAVGMAIGTDGLDWIDFNDFELAQQVGIVALALILFEGGLTTSFTDLRPVLAASASLAVIGTIVTAAVVGAAAWLLLGLSWLEALLLGSILASTDGAAVFAVLRGSTLRRRLARTLEGEAGLNDPVAVLLVVGFMDWATHPGYGIADMAARFAQELSIGLAIGVAVGLGGRWLLRRAQLASAGLYPVASIAVAALSFGAAAAAHGSGFLAVYLTGVVLATGELPARRTMVTFHAGLGWLAQVVMFLTLGLLVTPSRLGDIWLEAIALTLVMVFLARPAGVLLATLGTRFDVREKAVLGWAGLRGAVPVVLATFPVLRGVHGSIEFFDIVFFAVVASTILQGTTFETLAHRLGVTSDAEARPETLTDINAVRRLGAEVVVVPVNDGDAMAGARVRQLGLPRDALLTVVVRDEQAIPPRGSTQLLPGDRLHILVRQEAAIELTSLIRRWRSGPLELARRPRPTQRITHVPLTTGPWAGDDASRPTSVADVAVVAQLRTRRDGTPGAVVALADGRMAVTGPTYAAGGARALREIAMRRLRRATADAEQAWWREVVGALAQPE